MLLFGGRPSGAVVPSDFSLEALVASVLTSSDSFQAHSNIEI
jgi:hypothetical protein